MNMRVFGVYIIEKTRDGARAQSVQRATRTTRSRRRFLFGTRYICNMIQYTRRGNITILNGRKTALCETFDNTHYTSDCNMY